MKIKKLVCMLLAGGLVCSNLFGETALTHGVTEVQAAAKTIMGDYNCRELEDGTLEIIAYDGTDTEVAIPGKISGKQVTSVGDMAFEDCRNLTNISLPKGLTTIGGSAFYGCTSLVSINIPDSVSYIGGDAFTGTKWLEIEKKKSPCVIVNHILIDGSGCSGEADIPKEVTSIADYAFSGCKNLTGVNIPEGVTNIGYCAFENCSSLTGINIPKGVTNIGGLAFSCCSSLSSITIPESVTSIDEYAFFLCRSLRNITIPRTVTSIGSCALGYGGIDGDERIYICITGYVGSEAETYANANGIPFVDIENPIVNKAEQKITGTKTYKKTYGDKPFTLDARLTKGDGKISYSSSNTKIVSISQKGKATLAGVGISTITITAKETENYSKKTFKVKIEVSPRKPALNKPQVKAGRKLAVSWKRDADATGYEVWCSTDKNFKKNCKKAVIKKNKTVSHKFTGLKAGKKYYVRVHSYKTVKADGKPQTLKSKWSVKQSKKIQK